MEMSEESSDAVTTTQEDQDKPHPILFRENHLRMIQNLLSPLAYPLALKLSVFISGPQGCGKTTIIRRAARDLPHLYLDCSVLKSETQIASVVSKYLQIHVGIDEESITDKCQKVKDLPRILPRILKDKNQQPEVTVILDNFDSLCHPNDCFTALLQLQKVSALRINIICLSKQDASLILHSPVTPDLIEIHLPAYDKKELKALILESFDIPQSDDSAKNLLICYAESIVENFYYSTRDVREMCGYAHKFYDSYLEPISRGLLEVHQTPSLYKAIQPLLTEALQGRKQPTAPANSREVQPATSGSRESILSMPIFLRYLVIAGFLCSYNPSKSDDRMVAKRHERVRKEKAVTNRKRIKEKRLTVTGPQAFSLERLNGVFLCLVGDLHVRVCPIQKMANIRMLCDLRIFSRTGAEDVLDNPKFKCVCEKTFALQVAESLDFDLNQHLFDNIQNV